MAKTTQDALFERLRAQGLRKRVARDLAAAFGKGDGSRAPAAVQRTVGELRKLVDDLEDRVSGGSQKRSTAAKRSAAAKKAAATRKRQASQRSAAARKGARTRAGKR